MTITSTPVSYEIEDETGLLAKIEMFDSGASNVNIKTVVNHHSWPELSDAILKALQQMHGRAA